MKTLFAAVQSSAQPQTLEGPQATLFGAFICFYLLASVVFTVSYWIVFKKAGRKGWESIIPFYETWVRFELSGKPGWWLFPAIIPVVGLVLSIIASMEFCKRFGKGPVFGVMTAILPFIGYPILAFGKAEYSGAAKRAGRTDKHIAPHLLQ